MRFSTMRYVRPAKPQISLRIRAVWSEPLLVAWVFYDYQATDWTPFGVSKLNRRLDRLVWVYTCQNATLLEITCLSSFVSRQGGNNRLLLKASCMYWSLCYAWKKENKVFQASAVKHSIVQMLRCAFTLYDNIHRHATNLIQLKILPQCAPFIVNNNKNIRQFKEASL